VTAQTWRAARLPSMTYLSTAPCPAGHVGARRTRDDACIACLLAGGEHARRCTACGVVNPADAFPRSRDSREANPERRKATCAECRNAARRKAAA